MVVLILILKHIATVGLKSILQTNAELQQKEIEIVTKRRNKNVLSRLQKKNVTRSNR
jgi:hypothetical protein